MALRAALGARRGRLIGQLLTESLVLVFLGGAAGLAVACLLTSAAAPLVSASLPFTADLSLDLRVLGFAAAAAMLVLVLAGLLPSLQTSFSKLSGSLNQAGRGSSRSSAVVRRTIVMAEVAVSFMLDLRRGAAVQEPGETSTSRCRGENRPRDYDVGRSSHRPHTPIHKALRDSLKQSLNGCEPCPESSRHLSRKTSLFRACTGARGWALIEGKASALV